MRKNPFQSNHWPLGRPIQKKILQMKHHQTERTIHGQLTTTEIGGYLVGALFALANIILILRILTS